jgi:hypothetical protein
MASISENPYASPAGSLAPTEPAAPEPWKAIARRWELLRIPYNLIVGVCGLMMLGLNHQHPIEELVFGAVGYAVAANVCYTFGPLAEMYLNWFADLLEARGLALFGVRLVRSGHTTLAMFLVGLFFSVLLTFAVGAAAAFGNM